MKNFFAVSLTMIAGLAILLSATKSDSPNGLQVGDIAPNFKLKNVDESWVTLDDYPEAKGFIVAFTCNHCPFSVMYEDRIIALHQKYADQGYPVIAINPNDPEVQPDDSFENMQKRAKEKNFPFAYLIDEGQEVYPAYGAERTPHIFLLDSDRKVQYIGAIDDNPRNPDAVENHYVENAIAAMESGKTPDPSFTKAIGCTIKTQ